MKLLNTYTDKEEAEMALQKITGTKRLASERDSTEIIYNLFGQPTWNNFYQLKMFKLPLLQEILKNRKPHMGLLEPILGWGVQFENLWKPT